MTKNLTLTALLGAFPLLVACPSDDDPNADGDSSDTGDAGMTNPTMTMTTADDDDDDTADTTADTTGDDDDDDDSTSTGEPVIDPQIRVVHASPGAPAVDVYVEGMDDPVITNLAYTETSDYLEVPAGDYNFQVRAAGADPADPPVYETGDITLPEEAVVTAVAAGLIGGGEEDEFRVIPLIENFEDPGEGNAAVRILHAGSDAPTVGIDVGNDDPAAPELDGVDRFAESGEAGVALPAGAALQVGIAAGGETVTAFTTPELPEGANLFVIATGLLGNLAREDNGFGLLAVGPDGTIGLIRQNPVVYALHGSWNAGTVDICSGTTELFGDVAYDAFASIRVPPGDYPLSVYAGSAEDCSGPRPVYTTPEDVSLAAGEQYLAIAAGAVGGDPAFQFIVAQEQFTLDSDDGVVRAIHAAGTPGVAAVEVGLINMDDEIADEASVVIDGFVFGDESAELPLPEGSYPLGIGADVMGMANYPNATVLQATLDVTADTRAWAIASGLLGAMQPGNAITINLIDTTTSPWTCVTCD